MLRRKEDMKEWQRKAVAPVACQPALESGVSVEQMDEIKGVKAPEGISSDDAPEIKDGFIPEVKPKKAPAKKKTVKKVEKMPVE